MTTTSTTTKQIPEGFGKYSFSSLDEIENFIWGWLYDNGKQYFPPFQEKGEWFLIYEE